MEDITRLTVHELKSKLDKKEITSKEIVKSYINRINEKEKDVGAFVTLNLEDAEKEAIACDEEKEKKEYSGIPIGIKDNLCT